MEHHVLPALVPDEQDRSRARRPTTKQFGTPEQPRVVRKRSLDVDGNQLLDAWHQAARQNGPAARTDVTLTITETGGTITYLLHNAWPSRLKISGPVAGSLQAAVETVRIVCDEVTLST